MTFKLEWTEEMEAKMRWHGLELAPYARLCVVALAPLIARQAFEQAAKVANLHVQKSIEIHGPNYSSDWTRALEFIAERIRELGGKP